MNREFYLIVPGIECDESDNFHWSRQLATYFESTSDTATAEAYQYHVSWADRWLHQRTHTERLLRKIRERQGDRIILVGHSNGCDLIIRAIKELGRTEIIYDVYLFAAATEPDFRLNGLNDAMKEGRVGHVNCLCSSNDFVLKRLAPASRFFGHWFGLGFENLGFTGPTHVAESVRNGVFWVERNDYEHGSWFHPDNLYTWGDFIRGVEREEHLVGVKTPS